MMKKKIEAVLFTLIIICLPFLKVYATNPSFSLYPSGGIVKDTDEGLIVDVLIDSGGYEITKARAVLKFDPEVIQLRKASRNNSLFEQWPEDESSTDNTNGIVMLTGITLPGGSTPLYRTGTQPDVFERLEFDVISTDVNTKIVLDFQYSGYDEPFMSVIMKDATPSQNILTSDPASGSYTLNSDDIPQTAISMNSIGVILGIFLMLVGAFVRYGKTSMLYKRRGTIVLEK